MSPPSISTSLPLMIPPSGPMEVRSFTLATGLHGRSPSSLSQIVRRLEARLGLRLLARITSSVAVTAEGR